MIPSYSFVQNTNQLVAFTAIPGSIIGSTFNQATSAYPLNLYEQIQQDNSAGTIYMYLRNPGPGPVTAWPTNFIGLTWKC
ncbi:hypothetical protein GCM10027610_005830 [Dactylosporangium cerinum]